MRWLFAVLAVALLLARLPSVVQPAGGDQGIYAYIGQSILKGEVPYRDAWDQKPPGVHLTYAAMLGLWRNDSVVATTDLVVAALVAVLLVALGRRLTGRPGAGEAAAIVFLLLGDPSFQRLGGLWVRGQAETFIALAVTGAMLAALAAAGAERGRERAAFGWSLAAGMLCGAAFVYKYNAGLFALPCLLVYLVGAPADGRVESQSRGGGLLWRRLPAFVLGAALVVGAVAAWFAAHRALNDLYQATVVYNLKYSGETYAGFWDVVRYLVTFPVRHARVDALWFVGGVSCAALLLLSIRDRRLIIAPAWVAAACLSITVNSSRELPQYFVQAAPALALASGVAGAAAWRALGPVLRTALFLLLAVGVVRVNQFDKWAASTVYDFDHARGRTTREQYLSKFGGQRPTDKFSALATWQLGERLRAETAPTDRVLVLGFSAGALVRADRQSASRFFWSRPLLVGFNDGTPGYGAAGLLAELTKWRPTMVALQQRDWPVEGVDSATWFSRQPALQAWLTDGYRQVADTGTYFIWKRRDLP
jgi:4-amino-4-deoxy-L-arabinose transferase-like glycosyltransferase